MVASSPIRFYGPVDRTLTAPRENVPDPAHFADRAAVAEVTTRINVRDVSACG